MNKNEFIKELKKQLKGLKPSELQKSIFLAGRLNWPRMYGIAAVLVVITAVYFLMKYRKRKI